MPWPTTRRSAPAGCGSSCRTGSARPAHARGGGGGGTPAACWVGAGWVGGGGVKAGGPARCPGGGGEGGGGGRGRGGGGGGRPTRPEDKASPAHRPTTPEPP